MNFTRKSDVAEIDGAPNATVYGLIRGDAKDRPPLAAKRGARVLRMYKAAVPTRTAIIAVIRK